MIDLENQRRFSPAAERNTQPIITVLRDVLPPAGTILEIASGSGQHVRAFAEALGGLTWQPTECVPENLASIRAWNGDPGVSSVLAPVTLDVHWDEWPVGAVDGIVCINMIHIAPWSATLALFRGARRALSSGPLVLYGPYKFGGQFLAESNAHFHASLQSRDPRWGVRDMDEIKKVAHLNGFELSATHPMPANNHCLIFHRKDI